MARTRKTGYTLIELMVVCVILALFSALVAPNYVNIRDGQRRRAFYTSVADLAGTAREMAITRQAIMYLSVNTSLNRLEVKQEVNDSSYQAADGQTGSMTSSAGTTASNNSDQDNNPQTNIGTAPNDRGSDKVILTLPMAPGLTFGNFQLAGTASDSSSWRLEYFPDGTSVGGALEIDDRGAVRSLVVNAKGGSQLVESTIPDTTQDSWSAGNYVQRQQ
jgi:prepilin-type N-terminal cleavage/methylation domain-containing protein